MNHDNPWTLETSDAWLLSDPERAIGFSALGASIDLFQRWFSLWVR